VFGSDIGGGGNVRAISSGIPQSMLAHAAGIATSNGRSALDERPERAKTQSPTLWMDINCLNLRSGAQEKCLAQ
jgi:hypothetical protein